MVVMGLIATPTYDGAPGALIHRFPGGLSADASGDRHWPGSKAGCRVPVGEIAENGASSLGPQLERRQWIVGRARRSGAHQAGSRWARSRVTKWMPASVRVERARRIAERTLRGSLEADGTPVILHVRRVAKTSPDFARSVAWLHDVLEDSSVSEEELLASGLTDEELRALRLLTRQRDSRSTKHYLSHVSQIARSSGSAGEIARAVKRQDLADRQRHPNLRPDGWHPPYRAALALLQKEAPEPKRSSSLPPVANPLAERTLRSLSRKDRRWRPLLADEILDHALSAHQLPARRDCQRR